MLSQKISLVHIHSPGVAVEARIAAWLAGIPVIMTVHLPPYIYFNHSTTAQKLKLWLYSISDCILNSLITQKIIYVSSHAYVNATLRYSWLKKKSVFIPNGILLPKPLTTAECIREKLEVPMKRVVLCFVGRLEPQKGLGILMNALKMLPLTRRNLWELWIIGEGSVRQTIEELCVVFDLQDNIRFCGYQANIDSYLMEANIFVLPSRYEAMSIALMEAMANGLPCVVTDTGENSQLIAHGIDGFVTPVGDAHSLSHFLLLLIDNPLLCRTMGRFAREKAGTFSENSMVEALSNIYLVCSKRI